MRWLLVAALVACSAPPRRAPVPEPAPARFQVSRWAPPVPYPRLPRSFTPRVYTAHLAIHTKDLSGTIAIRGTLDAPTDAIWLDAQGMTFARARARGDKWSVPLEPRVLRNPVGEDKLVLLSAQPLPAGDVTIEIDYTAPITEVGVVDAQRQSSYWQETTQGIFRETFEGRSYVFTQFEPFFARTVFPCVDEPDRRALWKLTLDVPIDETAASNAPIAHETPLDATTKRVEFATTMPLPSYLVAFAIGPFDIVEAKSSAHGTPIRLLAQHGHGAAAKPAADQLPPILDALDAWTSLPYAFGKLDVVSVPMTGGGWFAMENAGLITVGEEGLRGRPGLDWLSIMTHEIAHQWFGNLVTVAWWNEIWLNESFTSWLADKIARQLRAAPDDWLASAREALEVLEPAANDPYAIAPQIRAPMTKSLRYKDLGPYFSGQRGAVFIAALEAFMGPQKLRENLQSYLASDAFRSATTLHLSMFLQNSDERHPSITEAVESTVDMQGTPRVWSEVKCDGARNIVRLSATSGWILPVCVRVDGANATEHCLVIRDTADVDVGGTCPRWVSPNSTGVGFYRTAWTPAMVEALARHGWPALSPRERARIVVELEGADTLTLPAVIALAATNANDPIARTWIASSLATHWHQVPDDLRSRLVAKLQPILERVRDRDLTIAAPSPDEETARAAELELAATIGDPAMVARGPALLRDLSKVPFPSMPWVRLLAARADASLIPELLASSVNDNASVLSRIPTIARFMPARDAYAPSLYIRLFQRACSVNDRTDALANTAEPLTSALAKAIDTCIAERAKLEPLFRGWLRGARAVDRRR